jgi:hypothetical protein
MLEREERSLGRRPAARPLNQDQLVTAYQQVAAAGGPFAEASRTALNALRQNAPD